ncbi:MAG: hypothetical protein ACTSPB_03455 [Candidatus Thorarchaeota archaeon]
MNKKRFTINLLWLYRNMGTEKDETPEDLMSYKEFVEFVRKADVYVMKSVTGDFLCIESEEVMSNERELSR